MQNCTIQIRTKQGITVHTIGIKIGYFPKLERTHSQKNPLLWVTFGHHILWLRIVSSLHSLQLIVVSKKF